MAYHILAETNVGGYRPAYDHLNEHETLDFTVKVVPGRFREDYDGNGERWVYLTASRPITRGELTEAVLWKFNRECRCEHDCCGHWQSHAYAHLAKPLNKKGTKWKVPVVSYRNI